MLAVVKQHVSTHKTATGPLYRTLTSGQRAPCQPPISPGWDSHLSTSHPYDADAEAEARKSHGLFPSFLDPGQSKVVSVFVSVHGHRHPQHSPSCTETAHPQNRGDSGTEGGPGPLGHCLPVLQFSGGCWRGPWGHWCEGWAKPSPGPRALHTCWRGSGSR